MRKNMRSIATLICMSVITLSHAQEYDDLYFNKTDRKKQKAKREKLMQRYEENYRVQNEPIIDEPIVSNESRNEPTSFLGMQYYNYSEAESLEPEVEENLDYSQLDQASQFSQNWNREQNLNPNVLGQDLNGRDVIVNNYYSNGMNNRFNNGWNQWGFNDPFFNPGFGWNAWGGNGFGVSFGWGNSFYDPFFGGFGWNNWGWNNWGWNNWGWRGVYDPFWCGPGYFGNRNTVVISGNEINHRNVTRGGRVTRGSVVGRSQQGRRVSVNSGQTGNRVNAGQRRSAARQQADNLNQSAGRRYSSPSVGGTSSRSQYSGTTRQGQSNRGTNRSYNRGSYSNQNSSSSRSSSTYSSPSGRTSPRSSGNVNRSSSRSSSNRSSSSVSRSSSSRSSGSSSSRSSSTSRSSSSRRGGN